MIPKHGLGPVLHSLTEINMSSRGMAIGGYRPQLLWNHGPRHASGGTTGHDLTVVAGLVVVSGSPFPGSVMLLIIQMFIGHNTNYRLSLSLLSATY